MYKLLSILLLAVCCAATTRTAATCGDTDIQTQINASADGDTVAVPAGTCTWSTGISWTDKNISVIGAGQGSTNITLSVDDAIKVTTNTLGKASFRISGLSLSAAATMDAYIYLYNPYAQEQKGWRVDHVTFNQTAGGSSTLSHPMQIIGILWGVVDHCTINDNGNGVQGISNYAYAQAEWGANYSGNEGRYSWETLSLGLGTDSAIYIEDCLFNFTNPPANGNPSVVNDTQDGGREVIRYNTIHEGYVMTHSAWGMIRGGLKLEVYGNTFTSTMGMSRLALLRSGTGVFFNNTVSGYTNTDISIDNERDYLITNYGVTNNLCDGSDPTYDGNTTGETGWPCEDQPGRGHGAWHSQTSQPWYAWNNGVYTFVTVAHSAAHVKGTAHSNGDVDYVNNGTTAMPGYTAYTYPHPLVSAVSTITQVGGQAMLAGPMVLRP